MKEFKQYSYEVSSGLAYEEGREYWKGLDYADVLLLLSAHWSQAPGKHLKIRERALEELVDYYSVPSLQDNPLQEGAVLGRIGNTAFSLKVLKEKLTPLGIKVGNTINEKTTHVLLGTNPKTTKGLENYKKTLLSSQLLQAELDRLEQPYLQEKDEQTTASVENLSQLLLSNNTDNILLALELMRGGGFPKVLIPQTFLAMKLSSDKQIYQEMKDLLDKYLSAAGKKAIRRTLNFSVRMADVHLSKHIHLFCRNVPDLDGEAIAWQLYQTHQKGIQYIWKYSSNKALKKKVLEDFVRGDTLTLMNKGVSLLPEELADYPQVTTVILQKNHFTTVPPVLTKLPALAHLNLAYNKIEGVHTRLMKMKNLKYLNLYGNLQYWNSLTLNRLEQLEELVLRDYDYEPARMMQEKLKTALPHCKLSHKAP
ncbi:MAG: leucine-rich repeat domain-containing protein [Aureispira sp.]